MHLLRYRIFSLLLDLEEIDALDSALRLFSRDRFNLLGVAGRDHGDGSDRPLRDQALTHLRQAGIERVGRIRLLAMPRLLGFVFNPLSIYFCEGSGGGLCAILYEVHNTFGERHTYVLPVEADGATVRQQVAKQFHVSPFLPMDLAYAFRIKPPADDLLVAIAVRDCDGPVLAATHQAQCEPLTDRAILRAVATHPLMTFKVVAAILFEAARLLAKGLAWHRHPPPPAEHATVRPLEFDAAVR